jgi:hypothetical protein
MVVFISVLHNLSGSFSSPRFPRVPRGGVVRTYYGTHELHFTLQVKK